MQCDIVWPNMVKKWFRRMRMARGLVDQLTW
jgi:hypothetical protein